MYKNITILDKEKSKDLKFDEVDLSYIGKNVGLIPLGFSEVWYASFNSAVIINSGENAEFLAFTGILPEISMFNLSNVYFPAFIRAYPFLSIDVNDDKNSLNSVIAIDENPLFVGVDKEHKIVDDGKNLTQFALNKVNLVRELNRQREVSRKIVKELKSKDLLIKKDLKARLNNQEKTILDEFYVVNIDKLLKLDDETIATWAKKGWMSIFDAHLKSISNFEKILTLNAK